MKLSALTPSAVQKFLNDLQGGENPIYAKSVHNVHGVLHQAFKQAVKLGYIRTNPCEACTLPRAERPQTEPLDAPKIKKLLDSMGDDVYSTAYKIDLFTGLRHGELLALSWDCVDFERGTILVNKQLILARDGSGYRFGALKNDRARTIQPAPYVMNLLRERRKAQLSQRLRAGSLWDEGAFPGLVFENEAGAHLCPRVVLKHFKSALERAGLPEKRLHDLRHTFAVTSLMAGDDVKTVQENLSHATSSFTLDKYGHVTETMREASSRRMQAFVDALK